MNLLFECGPKNGTRIGGRGGGGGGEGGERKQLHRERRCDGKLKVITILVLSRGIALPMDDLSMAASCTIVSQWLIVETRRGNVRGEGSFRL